MKKIHFLCTALVAVFLFPTSLFASGGDFVWGKKMGGTDVDLGYSTFVDGSGNIYTTGYFTGTADFDPGAGTSNLTSTGGTDIFISKLDSSGNFVWAKNMGGTSDDEGRSIFVDGSGNVYTTGIFRSIGDFDPNVGGVFLTSAGNTDVFISKLDSSGNFVWAKNIGGTNVDYGHSLVADGSGNVYLTGYFTGTADFDPGAGASNLTSAGSNDIFIVKLNSSGELTWARKIGGTSLDYGYSLKIDGSGNVYTTGIFAVSADFDPGAGTTTLTSAGNTDVFILKLDTNGDFVWVKQMGGTTADYGHSLYLDGPGNIYTTGYFTGTADFDPSESTANLTSAGGNDIFVSKLDTNGDFVWVKQFGNTGADIGYSISVDTTGSVYTTGSFEGTVDFDPSESASNLTSAGSTDVFVSKLSSSGNFMWIKQFGGTILDTGNAIFVDTDGYVYTTGYFMDTVDFDPGAGTSNLTSAGSVDIFVSKLSQPRPTVTYNGNTSTGGSVPVDGSSPYIIESTVTVLSVGTLTKAGYTFLNWNTVSDGTGTAYAPSDTFTATDNVTLYAQWSVNTYEVAFNGNTATSGTMANQDFTYDVSQNLTTNAYAKTGYTFSGWNTASDGSGTSYTDAQNVSNLTPTQGGTVTLYAQWEPYTFEILFNGNGNTGGALANQSFSYDNAQALSTNTYTKTGYTFAGWNTALNGSGTSYADEATVSNLTGVNEGVVTLYAQWSVNTYEVAFNGNTATSGTMANQDFTYDVSQNLTTNAYAKTGYTFSGWNTASDGSGTSYTDAQNVSNLTPTQGGTVTLYAQWTLIPSTTKPKSGSISYCTAGVSTFCRPQIVPNTPQTLSCSTPFTITKGISFGAQNNSNDVQLLEAFLNTYEGSNLPADGVYSENDRSKVIQWQEKYASEVLTPWGLTHGTGFVYTKSISKMKQIHESACTQKTNRETPSSSKNNTYQFNENLQTGMVQESVKALQKFLNTQGFTVAPTGPGSLGNETTRFGAGTRNALIQFQKTHNITPALGYFGPKTRAFINNL